MKLLLLSTIALSMATARAASAQDTVSVTIGEDISVGLDGDRLCPEGQEMAGEFGCRDLPSDNDRDRDRPLQCDDG